LNFKREKEMQNMYRIDEDRIQTKAFINGEYVESIIGEKIKKNSSATGRALVPITSCGTDDVNKAVSCAKRAFDNGTWKDLPLEERKKKLMKLAELMERDKEELASLDAYETGRAYRNYIQDSIPKAIEAIRYFAEALDKIYDKAINPGGNEFGMVVREPLGVVGIITPWNDPMVVASWKFAPALLMGNSVVIKPAEQSSLSLIKTAELVKEAGIPAGVFNVIPGYGEIAGKALALHQDVRGIFFTGSSVVGKLIMEYAGKSNMKKVGLECGGKSPYIVSEKCSDLERAASVLAQNVFYNQGQICSAPSRVIVHKKVKEEFLKILYKEAEKYVPGNPYDFENEVGCVVSREQYEKIKGYIEIGKKEAGGWYSPRNVKEISEKACGVVPVIFFDVKKDAVIAQEEIFGPVLTVLEYETFDEAIDIANATQYGLAGAVWTDDLDEAYHFVKEIKAGIVHVNSYGDDNNMAPFGGMKESGIGKDKSAYAFEEYSELKTVWMKFK
jgi:acyl-CoA reductase-like NAD-dependent aldehyde dehydrogenase